MFMRVNSKCAHQARPPSSQLGRSAAVRQPLDDCTGPNGVTPGASTVLGRHGCGTLLLRQRPKLLSVSSSAI